MFSGGGTLGHIYPALSFIKILKKDDPNLKIIYLATSKDQKYQVLTTNEMIDQKYYLNVKGRPKSILKYPKVLYDDIKSLNVIKKIIKKEQIDLVIGMGGYLSGITIYIAHFMKIPCIIHEQNSYLGLANKWCLNKVDYLLTSFPTTYNIKKKYQKKLIFVGNPRYLEIKAKVISNFFPKILITSGSLGSKKINEVVIDLINSPDATKYQFTLVTGERYYQECLEKIPSRYNFKVLPFSNNLVALMNEASIIISRAGSTTLFEILALKKPAIIIPSSNVTNNHQYYNAKALSDEGLIVMINEKDFNYLTLRKAIIDLFNNYQTYQKRLENFKNNFSNYQFIDIIKKIKRQNNND